MRVKEALSILDTAIERHRPTHVFALFSGGHDSLCSTHLTSLHPRFSGVVHVNTGIGIQRTRQFVRETCEAFGWRLKEYHPPMSFEKIVAKWGFPGPAGHALVYQRLKERCIRRLIREHKCHRHDRIVLVTGCRKSESRRRMGNTDEVQKDGVRVWVAPLTHWTNADKDAHMAEFSLPKNPVVGRLCMSGECLCGAFAQPDELETIRFFFPEAAAEIDRLADIARRNGKHAVWGTRPPEEPRNRIRPLPGQLSMCWSCEAAFSDS